MKSAWNIVFALLLVAAVAAADEVRTWTTTKGASLEAKLEHEDAEGRVHLVTPDGKKFSVPRASLSAADVSYLDERQAAVLWEQMQKGRAKRKEEVIQAAKERTASLAIDRDFFGVHLGETTGELEARCTEAGLAIDKTAHRFADPDHPAAIWTLAGAANGNEAVAETRLHVYRNRVYTVDLYMKDASLPNFEALKASLAKKYENTESPPGDAGALRADFQAEVDGQRVSVVLERLRDGGADVVRVRYVHDHIQSAVDRMTRMVKRKKVSTIEDDL